MGTLGGAMEAFCGAWAVGTAVIAPQKLQNFALSASCFPHLVQNIVVPSLALVNHRLTLCAGKSSALRKQKGRPILL
jgi:hypothetical protein